MPKYYYSPRCSFITAELPAPLNIDLSELFVYGACPVEAEGKTHDGFEIYGRYDAGWLQIIIANKKGEDPLDNGTEIMKAYVGPDTSPTQTQFCQAAGLTVNGKVPEENWPRANRTTDVLSGAKTIWKAELQNITDKTSRQIIDACREVFPKALLVQPVYGEGFKMKNLLEVSAEKVNGSSLIWLIDGVCSIGDIKTSSSDYVLPSLDQLQINFRYHPWKYKKSIVSTSQSKYLAEQLGRVPFVLGFEMPEEIKLIECSLKIYTEFPTTHISHRKSLEKYIKILNSFLPRTNLELVNLKTGDVIGNTVKPVDPVSTEWCNQGVDRWLSVETNSKEQSLIGLRPEQS